MTSRLPVSISARRERRAIAVAIAALAAVLILACGVGTGVALAQNVDLPRDAGGRASVEVLELRTALKVAQEQLAKEKLRTAEVEQKRLALAESLAAANAEAEAHRKSYRDLLLKLEALGVDLLSPDRKGLESRLLKAVRDRDLFERELAAVTDQLFRLTEAFVSYMHTATSDDADARSKIEAELLATEKVFQRGRDAEASGRIRAIAEGKVVSLDPEIGLVVLNVGKDSGVRVGMPLELLRQDRPIGDAVVVDVRDSVCGAVIRSLIDSGDDARIGDRVRPRAGTSL